MVLQDQAAHALLLCGCQLIKQAGGLPDSRALSLLHSGRLFRWGRTLRVGAGRALPRVRARVAERELATPSAKPSVEGAPAPLPPGVIPFRRRP